MRADQNPAGKTERIPDPFPSAKVPGQIPQVGLIPCKLDSWVQRKATADLNFGGNNAYFGQGQRFAPRLPEEPIN